MTEPSLSLRQSSSLRLGLLISACFVIANTIAFSIALYLSQIDLNDRAEQRVLEEVASFKEVYRFGGAPSLIEQIRVHAVTATSGDEVFFLFDKTTGNTNGNAKLRETFEGWRRLTEEDLNPLSDFDPADEYLAFGAVLGDQLLIVAQSTASVEELSELFAGSFLAALLASTLIALTTTALFVWRSETRIRAIARTLDAVSGGRYSSRVQGIAGRSDDLARIAGSINAMLDRLEDNIAGLRQVSADIAHDLKTPLQRLRTTLESLQASQHNPQAASEIAADAIVQADTIVRIFQALLRIAQIEGGSPKARFRMTDMREICESVGEAFQPAAEDAGHVFTLTLAGSEPVPVDGDRDLLAQMLSNLIENAIRHAPPPAAIGMTLIGSGDGAIVEITDTGPGIPADEAERVFRRLYRLERSRTSEGSGLGLAMVAAIVELHRGSIELADNDPGLKVVVRLPSRQ